MTIYGDVVEPRGGMLWMGTLIECCGAHGLSETLVRTAVSRLVAAGRLEGLRIGRRSYYRLSDAARSEFRAASRLLFLPPPASEDWLFCLSETSSDQELGAGWVRLSPTVAIAPNREGVAPVDGVVMRAGQVEGQGDLRSFAREKWALEDVAHSYQAFLDRHQCLLDGPSFVASLSPEEALARRLRLVHDYRQAALIDPRLPPAACPTDWPAERARRLFVTAYLGLSGRADAFVGETFLNDQGALEAVNAETEQRLSRLESEAASWARAGSSHQTLQ
ncbi:ArsR family transcriptional regulator [Pseudohoeflea suaedae]|uniref:ArsR family transcriptional regulator n=1 Tax=Pseudohoeflea suaedae TaxID=877384 RepID=A0A4R5PK29_9HYPH|nr:ArsR family transcriptional regulator [Pseudohoeflea suaedae]